MLMQINVPSDIADALRIALNALGVDACAEPLPRDLADRVPLTLVQPMGGGGRTDVVLDQFAVRLYTWGADEGAAMDGSRRAMAALCLAEGNAYGGTQVYRVTPTAGPYPAADPLHPDLPRACSTAYVWARATTTDI